MSRTERVLWHFVRDATLCALVILSFAPHRAAAQRRFEAASESAQMPWGEEAALLAAGAGGRDQLGWAVALSGDGSRAIVGALGDDTAAGEDAGSARVFVRSGSAWVEEAALSASDAAGADRFGCAVGISSDGSRAIVGVTLDDTLGGRDAGSARVFVRSGSVWVEEATLLAGDAAARDRFGGAVAISADGIYALVGASRDDTMAGGDDAGSARVFVRDGSVWAEQTTLIPHETAGRDRAGISVALSADGSRALLGAYGDDTTAGGDAGSAHVFVRSGSAWAREGTLLAEGAGGRDQLGVSVALSADGSRALVGAYGDDTALADDVGSARVFVRSGATWAPEATLVASDGAGRDQLGISVALSADGDRALVGAHGDDGGGTEDVGSARLFVRSGGQWHEAAVFNSEDPAARDQLGAAVALSADGTRALVGAGADDTAAGRDAGTARVFTLGRRDTSALFAGARVPEGDTADEQIAVRVVAHGWDTWLGEGSTRACRAPCNGMMAPGELEIGLSDRAAVRAQTRVRVRLDEPSDVDVGRWSHDGERVAGGLVLAFGWGAGIATGTLVGVLTPCEVRSGTLLDGCSNADVYLAAIGSTIAIGAASSLIGGLLLALGDDPVVAVRRTGRRRRESVLGTFLPMITPLENGVMVGIAVSL